MKYMHDFMIKYMYDFASISCTTLLSCHAYIYTH